MQLDRVRSDALKSVKTWIPHRAGVLTPFTLARPRPGAARSAPTRGRAGSASGCAKSLPAGAPPTSGRRCTARVPALAARGRGARAAYLFAARLPAAMNTKTATATSAHQAMLSVSCCHFRTSHMPGTPPPRDIPHAGRARSSRPNAGHSPRTRSRPAGRPRPLRPGSPQRVRHRPADHRHHSVAGQPAGSVVSTPAAGRVWVAYAKTLKRGRTRLLPEAPGTVFAGSRVVTLARTGGRGE
jgi:hypothetical protein